MERSGNTPYKEIYNIAHNIIGFEGIVKGDLTACQAPCYLLAGSEDSSLPAGRQGFKDSRVFIKILIPLVKSLHLNSWNPGTLGPLNPFSKGGNP
jgi:hypothetical protein